MSVKSTDFANMMQAIATAVEKDEIVWDGKKLSFNPEVATPKTKVSTAQPAVKKPPVARSKKVQTSSKVMFTVSNTSIEDIDGVEDVLSALEEDKTLKEWDLDVEDKDTISYSVVSTISEAAFYKKLLAALTKANKDDKLTIKLISKAPEKEVIEEVEEVKEVKEELTEDELDKLPLRKLRVLLATHLNIEAQAARKYTDKDEIIDLLLDDAPTKDDKPAKAISWNPPRILEILEPYAKRGVRKPYRLLKVAVTDNDWEEALDLMDTIFEMVEDDMEDSEVDEFNAILEAL